MKTHCRLIFPGFFALMLVGCASRPTINEQGPFDANQPSARVRFYGNNGIGGSYYQNTSCTPRDTESGVRVAGGWGENFGSFIRTDQSVTIGMPETERSRNRNDGLLAREYLKEYRIPGGQPITVSMGMSAMAPPAVSGGAIVNSSSCSPHDFYFTPEAGKDYEIFLAGSARGGCNFVAMEITAETSTAVKKFNAPSCPQVGPRKWPKVVCPKSAWAKAIFCKYERPDDTE